MKLIDEVLTSFVHVKDGFILQTNKPTYYYFEIGSEEPKNLNLNLTESSDDYFIRSSLIAYNPKSEYTYVIYPEKIFYFKVNEEVQELELQFRISNLASAVSSQNLLMIASIDSIYTFSLNNSTGQPKFEFTIEGKDIFGTKQVQIMQIKIGGIQGQNLYVLDYFVGVAVITIWQTKDEIKYKLATQLGVINIHYAYKFDQYNDESLLMIAKTENRQKFLLYDFSIDVGKGIWFLLSSHIISGNAEDIDIARYIAVIKGVDSHSVVFHSIYHDFTQNKQIFEIYTPNLIKLDLFEQDYGKPSNSKWHYNQNHTLIFGITGRELLQIEWSEIPPQIECYTENEDYLGREFFYKFLVNTTDCRIKQEKLGDVLSRDLVICTQETDVKLRVVGVLAGNNKKIALIVSSVVSVVLIAILIVVLAYKYYKYKSQQSSLYHEIDMINQNRKKQKEGNQEQKKEDNKDKFSIEDDEEQ